MTYPSSPSETDKLSIRLMSLEDIPQVHKIDLLSFTLPWPEKSYHFELTENPNSLALVAELPSTAPEPLVIGMSVAWIIVDEAHIATIAIHPDFRGHGYGRRLLAETLRQSIKRGARMATLEVRAGNSIAQQLYCSFGFTIGGQRQHYYHDNNEDAVVMTVENMGLQYLTWLNSLG